MDNLSFLHRACPNCGLESNSTEVESARRAERMSLDDLRPFWSGLFKEKVFFSYSRCAGCGLLFAPEFFTDPQLQDLYSDMAPNMEALSPDAIEATQLGYFQAAAASGPLDASYLEIGPDIGYIARHAAREGRFDHFYFFEPNIAVHPDLAASVEGRAFTISEDMNSLSAVPDDSVGLAVIIHVLDHILDPVHMLGEVRSKLKRGGRVVIVTHNEKSLLRHLMGKQWPPFCLQHPELYNPQSISTVLGKAGFVNIDCQRSKNYFPIDFMARQAAYRLGVNLRRLPMPKAVIGLRLGNMLTIAERAAVS